MTTVGVLGGSFDPVHRGHIALACHAGRTLGLDQVLLLPCAHPPHKAHRVLAERFHRLEMLYLATEGRPGIRISTHEIAREGVHYTIDTLRALRAGPWSWAPVFLCGSDALAEIGSWREHDALLAEFDFAAMVRPEDPGGERPDAWPDIVERRVAAFPPPPDSPLGRGGRVFRVAAPGIAVSSSLVRQRRTAGAPIDDLVAARVDRYIQRHRLFTEEAAR